MRHRRFMRDNPSLLALYENNYMLFRLLLPHLPQQEGWYVLESEGRRPAYLHRVSLHPYTSEWLLAHHFPHHAGRLLAPDHQIRVYHDARLVEARIDTQSVPVTQQRQAKVTRNRALGEWLDYCYRHGYRLNVNVAPDDLPDGLPAVGVLA
ncbi:DUF1249 domain-containing protein [Cardiobacteriaceae bacterium TAE3-ERU3]|nr:DUF1249 domain-containing protein [Cardiobacteriaceae bacterium TAE3-ERU3]